MFSKSRNTPNSLNHYIRMTCLLYLCIKGTNIFLHLNELNRQIFNLMWQLVVYVSIKKKFHMFYLRPEPHMSHLCKYEFHSYIYPKISHTLLFLYVVLPSTHSFIFFNCYVIIETSSIHLIFIFNIRRSLSTPVLRLM